MAAGTGKVKLELFVNSPEPAGTLKAPANPKANPSKMVIGQERDAIEHPGVESVDGEIARFLIFARPLDDAELKALLTSMQKLYGI